MRSTCHKSVEIFLSPWRGRHFPTAFTTWENTANAPYLVNFARQPTTQNRVDSPKLCEATWHGEVIPATYGVVIKASVAHIASMDATRAL